MTMGSILTLVGLIQMSAFTMFTLQLKEKIDLRVKYLTDSVFS